jgi:hypothetical protein
MSIIPALLLGNVWSVHRLEPQGVLHMAGQGVDEFEGYRDYLPSDSRPLAYTTYHSLWDLNATGGGEYFDKLKDTLDLLGDADRVVLPHISLALTPGGTTLDLINQGAFDFALGELAKGLPRIGRPVFLRVGYEFNGHWNNYSAASYVQAWKRIEKEIAKNITQRERTALVWDMTCDETGDRTDWKPYFPGANVVDWWGVNVFQPGKGFSSLPNATCVLDFVAAAASQSFPVLIAEAMPRYIGTNSNSSYTCRHPYMKAVCNTTSWDSWFQPFFDVLLAQPAVKGFSYIDRNCLVSDSIDSLPETASIADDDTLGDDMLGGKPHKCEGGQWGDARIETSSEVGPKYKAALMRDGFIHAASLHATCTALGVAGC